MCCGHGFVTLTAYEHVFIPMVLSVVFSGTTVLLFDSGEQLCPNSDPP